ncbi:MAG: porin [Rhodoferax sp.]
MKKTLVALAALAATGAFAQSTVSIWGAVDASYNYASGDMANGTSQNKHSLGNSQLGSSKLGFSGLEDLGGGLKAKFWLEAGLANDTGAGKGSNSNNQPSGAAASNAGGQGIVFARRSYVGLVGNWGELKLGREYVNTFLGVQASVDPFGTNGPADSTQMMLLVGSYLGKSSSSINASNMITYVTPTMSGFSGNVQYFMGENLSGATQSDDGNGYSVTGQWAQGPFFVSLGQMGIKYNQVSNAGLATGLGDFQLQALAASYDFGVAKIRYTYANESVTAMANTGGDWKNISNLFAVSVPYGAFNFKGSYIMATNNFNATKKDTKGSLLGLGVDYALSKRSIVYATWGGISNSDGGSMYGANVVGALKADGGTSNLAIGMYHSF